MLDATYICPNCGEEIVIPVDPSEGDEQEYIEDCPVCCAPNQLNVSIYGGSATVEASSA